MADPARNLIPDREGLRDTSGRITPVTDLYVDSRLDSDIRQPDRDVDVLTRIIDTDPQDAQRRLQDWLHGGPPPAPLAAPGGIRAWERMRRDTRPRTAAGPAMRVQRIAVAIGDASAHVAYWSAPDPVHPADEAPWRRALARLAGEPDPGGWSA